MNATKPYDNTENRGPSTFALLVDDINKMTEAAQKLLWIKLNKERLSLLAKEIDAAVVPHNLSASDIDTLIDEAKKYKRDKKES